MTNRQILLLLLAVVVAESRPQAEIPQYPLLPFNFGYEVSSENTGDTKTHQETLEDDGILRGSYTVVQPDGLKRIVKYTSDAENGFRADVTFERGYENVIPQVVKDQTSTLSAGSSGSSRLSQGSSLSSSSGKPLSLSSVGFASVGSTLGGANRQGSTSGGLSSRGSSTRVSSTSEFTSGGTTRVVSTTSGGSPTGESKPIGFTSGAGAQFSSLNSAKPSSGSFPLEHSGSLQGLSSPGFISSNSLQSDIAEPENAQFTAHIAPFSSHTTSSGSSVQDNTFTNDEAASSSGSVVTDGTANLLSQGSFGDIYSNRQLFCAGCNTEGFDSSKVISNANTVAANSVPAISDIKSSSININSATVGSSSVGFASGAASTVGSTSAGATSSGSVSTGFTSGGSSIGSISEAATPQLTSGGSSTLSFTPGASTTGLSSSVGFTSGESSTGESSSVSLSSGGSSTGGSVSGGVDFGDLFSRSFLVASENLDSIDEVQLSNAGFNTEQLYAYKLVPIKIVEESTTV